MGDGGASIRIDYARMRLKKIHAEMLVMDEQLRDDNLPPHVRRILVGAKRNKVLAASRWAQLITDLQDQWSA
jgi:hypothetical protein